MQMLAARSLLHSRHDYSSIVDLGESGVLVCENFSCKLRCAFRASSLNLGLTDQTVEALATKTGNPRFAWDCYRRFVQMYGDVVLGVQKRADEDHDPFETVIHALKHERYHEHCEHRLAPRSLIANHPARRMHDERNCPQRFCFR